MTALLSVLIGSGASLLFLNFSWMVGLPVGFVSYVALRKVDVDGYTEEYLSDSQSPAAD